MRRFSALIVLIVLVVLLSGCPQPPEEEIKDPIALYKQLVEKGRTMPNGKFSYKMTYGLGEGETAGISGMSLSSIDMDIDIYSLNGNMKTVITMAYLGQSAIIAVYEVGGEVTTCMEASGTYVTGGNEVMCQEGDQTTYTSMTGEQFTELFDDLVEEMDITYKGKKIYAGRGCYDFSVKIDSATLQKAIETQEREQYGTTYGTTTDMMQGARVEYNVCLDKELGFSSYYEMLFFMYSELAGKETTMLSMSMELESFDPNGASQADLELPADVEVLPIWATSYIVCNSNDPTKIMTMSYDITAMDAVDTPDTIMPVEIILQNTTGGEITNVYISAADEEYFSGIGELLNETADATIESLPAGEELTINPKYAQDFVPGDSIDASYTITYTDQFDFTRTADVFCMGTA